MKMLYLAYLALSLIPCNVHAVEVIHWDRPTNGSYKGGPDVVYDGSTFRAAHAVENALLANESTVATGIKSARAAKDFYLRIMPLGASITQGQYSSDENGYRKFLRQQLRWKGWQVNMVGSKNDGDMKDNQNEGWRGYTIGSVNEKFKASAHLKPNLVLVNAGTNDCNVGDGSNAARDMKSMLDEIYSRIDGVTVILSTLVPSTKHPECAAFISEQYRNLVKTQYAGRRIGLADIHAIFPTNLLYDDTHPNDQGYKLFAAVWWEAISRLENTIQPPLDNGVSDTQVQNTCRKVAGTARGPVKTQQGSGHNDGNYVHKSEALGNLTTARIEHKGDSELLVNFLALRIFFANLIKTDPNAERSQALDDWIRVWTNEDKTNYVWNVRRNKGNGDFDTSQEFKLDQDCPELERYYGFDFADFNGDGLDDFLCYRRNGAVTLSLNRGGNPPRFEYAGQIIGGVVSGDWNYEEQVYRFGDIDGDGRADFCILDATTVRNGGKGDEHFWQGFKQADTIRDLVFSHGRSGLLPRNMHLRDLNGDFRADFLYVGLTGTIETWINTRGVGKSIVPTWRYAGQTHAGQAVKRDISGYIKLAKIMGSGRLDYAYVMQGNGHSDVNVWRNLGAGGTKLNADGSFYCDMRGSGSDDLVWIYDSGASDEINTNIHNPPNWGHDTTISFSVPGPRVGIHLADWTGNGRCDILVQDKDSGALTLYENNYSQSAKSISFINRGVVAPGSCTQGWGTSIFDRGMRIADVDGDGRADVLCLETSGRITGVLNRASGLLSVGQIKFAEPWDRANLRFADVEASGRADIVWLDKYTGAATVFTNNGYQGANGPGDSSFSWTNRGLLYAAIDRGENMHFANLGGQGRADLVQLVPSTNEAYTNFNECGGSGGDDGPIVSPNLPNVPDVPSGDSPTPVGYPGDETPYRVIPPGVTPDNRIGTYLWGYFGCTLNFPGSKGKIDDAYYDAWQISNTEGVGQNIDWNNAAALEFLGPPGLNKPKQAQIQAVFANMATMIYSYKNPFQHYIKVRCDDPYNLCQNRDDQDPCKPQPDPTNPDEPPKPTPNAYSINSDKDSPGVPMINFCAGFFGKRSLKDAITYGNALLPPYNLKLDNYDSRAKTFFHELLHLDLAAASPDPNPRIVDLKIDIKTNDKVAIGVDAYGPFNAKVLARYIGNVGGFTQRNDDNLAYYALAKYVMTKNGNVYPHIPVIRKAQLSGPPYYSPPGTVATFIQDGSNFYLNVSTSEDLSTWTQAPDNDIPGCSNNGNDVETVSITGFSDDSAYPTDYVNQRAAWIKALSG